MKKYLAFTLAETLIVMGVIGIVSALTLPNLNSSTGDKERVAKVKKIYRDLNDAFGRAEAVYGPFEDWFVSCSGEGCESKRVGERITEFMKLSKSCALTANQGCFSGSQDTSTTHYKVITADGTSLAIKSGGSDGATFDVDIDGPAKGNNSNCKEHFYFQTSSNSFDGISTNSMNDTFSNIVKFSYNKDADACTTWITKYDNADYLKFTDNTGKCPNGTTVTEANPRCK